MHLRRRLQAQAKAEGQKPQGRLSEERPLARAAESLSVVKLSELRPNPFRNLESFPLNSGKVAALEDSIRETTFWPNVVARPGAQGYQIAYGHHRIEAARRVLGSDAEVHVVVRELPDALMLKMMANENMSDWASDVAAELETVRAVVNAYADGKIRLQEPGPKVPKGQIRYAPAFGHVVPPGDEIPPRYSAHSIAAFLGWTKKGGTPQRRVYRAMEALGRIEDGELKREELVGKTPGEADGILKAAKEAAVAKAVSAHRNRAPLKDYQLKAIAEKLAGQLNATFQDDQMFKSSRLLLSMSVSRTYPQSGKAVLRAIADLVGRLDKHRTQWKRANASVKRQRARR